MNYLALDYGEHRVGVAFADSEFRMAFSRETIDQKMLPGHTISCPFFLSDIFTAEVIK